MRTKLFLIGAILCFTVVDGFAERLNCNVVCGPDTTAAGYSTVVASRTAMVNQRTGGQPLHVVSKLPFMVRSVQSSQSYDYSVNLLTLRGRNGLDVNLSLSYNSKIWSRSSSGLALNADLDNPSYGFRGVDFGFLQKNSSASDYILTGKNGAKSELFSVSGSTLYQSHDSTYLQFDSSTNILVARDGTQTFFSSFADGSVLRPIKIENTNGNFISLVYLNATDLSLSTITDTLGRTISFSYNASGKLAGISQGSKTITFNWNTTYVLNYNFSLSVVGSAANGSTQTVLSGVTFADGTSVNFLYGDWGIVNRIERRSSSGALRAYVSYNFPTASAGALTDSPGFSQQTMFDGVNTATWNYGIVKNSSGLVTSFAITDPSGVTTNTTFSANGNWQDGLPLGEQVTNAGGKVWRETIRSWTADNTTTGVNPHLASVITQSDDGTQSQIKYGYDANGNITDVQEYDFGAAGPGALLRETVTSFASLGNHILNRPSQILVKDGAGNVAARTDFAYDQYSSFPLKLLSPAAVQHDDINYSTTPTAARGNVTTKTVYANASAAAGAIATTNTYDVAGNKIAVQTGCCTQASSSFSSLTQYAFPDSVIIGPTGNQLAASFTYNFDTGTVATATDANGEVTSFAYDVDDRTTSTHTPDGVTVSTAFDNDGANPASTTSNSADSQVLKITKDFAGHVLTQQVLNGTALISTVTSTHDPLGRLLQISNPYGPSDAAVYTTYSYDPLGREVEATAPAVVSGTAQASSQISYSGHVTLYADPAGRQRREYRNALGQITQVDEPGNPFPGTASQGTVTVSGVVRGSVTVSITGADRSIIAPDAPQPCGTSCPKIYDSGDACITINGANYCAGYAQGVNSTAALMASAISSSINSGNGDPYVTATPSGSSVILAARSGVTISSIPISFGADSDDPSDFPTGSYHGTVAAPAYDFGTVSVSVNGFTGTAVSYGSNSGNTTAQQIATALAATLNVSGSPVTAQASGAGISVNYKSVGAAGNTPVTISSSPNNPTTFPGGSFSGSTTLAGGQDIDTTGINHPNSTQYSYNALGLLAQVTEGQQVRKFNYDSLGRLLSQNLPEKNNLGDTFTYTDFGAVATRTDARGVKATYSYDALDRVSSIVYSDGTPTITYSYGAAGAPNFAAGRITKITDGAGSESYQYDAMGRVIQCTRVIGANTYVTAYSYTADGRLASMTYPSGRVVTDQYDGLGRLTQVGSNGSSLLNIGSYNAAGQALGFTYGNGAQAAFTYNAQLQVASILYGPSTSPTLSLSYDWGGATDDGLLMGVTDDANSARSTSYSYDQLRRLVQAQTADLASANTWNLQFTYDRYGNRLTQTPAGGTATMPSSQVAVDPATNRITSAGYSYDADGDVTAEGGHAYSYDAEHRLIHVDGTASTYAYDGSGQRVNRNGNYYIYASGRVIAEYAGGAAAASPTAEYVYARGKRVATIAAGATTYHYWDHTSIRSSADSTGGVVRTYGHYPFGETWYETGTPDKWKFTTYERDAESGLDYAMARFHSSRMGRFMSLDPWPAAQHNPQSWNRYAYAQNNPISLVDPSGMDECDDEDAGDGCVSGGGSGSENLGTDGSGQNNGTDPGDDGSGGDGSSAGDSGSGSGNSAAGCPEGNVCLPGQPPQCIPSGDGDCSSGNPTGQPDNNTNQPGTDSGTDGSSDSTMAGNTDNSNDQGTQQQPTQPDVSSQPLPGVPKPDPIATDLAGYKKCVGPNPWSKVGPVSVDLGASPPANFQDPMGNHALPQPPGLTETDLALSKVKGCLANHPLAAMSPEFNDIRPGDVF